MFVRRLAVVGLLAAAAVPAVPAARAQAHGAPVTPISRSAACAGNGAERGAKACKAALAATGGFLGAYDNVRLAGVNGKDRRRIPDGKLCSAGLDSYAGLDLVRADFPATKVKSGQRLAVSYRGTIPHQGQFRIYVTRPGYDPGTRLTWDDLSSEPLAEITDPPLTGGAYRMRVTLPKRTGRHLLYVVWETSSTPDTYYSCSDLVFPAAAAPATTKAAATTKPATAAPRRTTAAPSSPMAPEPSVAPEPSEAPLPDTEAVAVQKADPMISFGHWLIMGALSVAALAGAGAGLAGLRRRRRN